MCLLRLGAAEFKRVVRNTDLLVEGIDGLVPRPLEVYQAAAKSGKKQGLKDILDCHEKDVSVGADERKMRHYLLFAIRLIHLAALVR